VITREVAACSHGVGRFATAIADAARDAGRAIDSAPGNFDLVTFVSKQGFQKLALVALYFHRTLFYGTADAAALLEFFRQRLEFVLIERQAPDDGDGLAAASFALTVQADNPV